MTTAAARSYHPCHENYPSKSAREFHELAWALHEQEPIVDGHADTLDRSINVGVPFGPDQPQFHIDVPRLREVGINLQVLSLWVSPDHKGDRALWRSMRMASVLLEARRRDAKIKLIKHVKEVQKGRTGFVFSFEGAEPLADDPQLLETWYALGVRMIALTWNGRNGFADGLTVSDRPGALTHLGRAVVKKMADLGVVLDLAHIAEVGFWHALEVTDGPVAVSHANARACWDHPRNMTDDQLRAVAARQGVVGACFVPKFICDDASLEDLARHILHMVTVAGIDHVGLGGDFDGVTELPRGLTGVQDLPKLTALLLQSGLAADDVAKILGRNWLRVFDAVWK